MRLDHRGALRDRLRFCQRLSAEQERIDMPRSIHDRGRPRSVFPTSGYANPTLTIVALAMRLRDHLKERLA